MDCNRIQIVRIKEVKGGEESLPNKLDVQSMAVFSIVPITGCL